MDVMIGSELADQFSLNFKSIKSELTDGVNVDWFRVIEIQSNDFMGITKKGLWVVEGAAGLIPLDKIEKFIFVSLLIEKPYKNIVKELRKLEFSSDGNLNLVRAFPFIDIIKARLTYPSDYWLGFIIDWYDCFDEDQKQSLKVDFENIRNSSRLSQKARHKVKKVLKYLNRNAPVMRKTN